MARQLTKKGHRCCLVASCSLNSQQGGYRNQKRSPRACTSETREREVGCALPQSVPGWMMVALRAKRTLFDTDAEWIGSD